LTVVLAATAVLVGVAGGFAGRTPATLNEPVLLSQPAPPGSTLASGGILSPDSRYMVSVVQDRGATQARLYLKQMNSGDLRLLAGTEGASHPFWSPTSDVIGFFANRALKTVNLRGDAPTVITTVPVSASGGTWSSRGSPILFADWQIGLYQVSPFGGTATRVTTINRAAGERAHNLPQFLPDGRHYLFFVLSSNADRTGTYVGSLDPGEPARLVVQSGSAAVYADPGYLLYVQNNGLVARQFDAARLQLRGAPQTLARDVSAPNDGEGQLISASSSLLTYRSGAKDLELAWFDREGRPAGIIPGGRALRSPMFSSDQKQLVAVSDRASLWVVDLERNAAARAEGEGLFPLWSPDGSRVAFESPSSLTLYVRNIDGPLREQVILQDGDRKILSDWSAAGDYLVYSTLNPVGNLDVSVIPMSGDKKPVALLRGPSNEMQARISPNGRSMAYVSDESGTLEVYVQDFPMLGHKRIVSIGGGTEPAWRQDGKELYYLSPDYSLVAVPIGSTDPLQIGQPKPLFRAPVSLASTRNHYAVTADGQRFLINVADEVSYRSPITVMVNWMQGLHAQ
jgi:Tol biopolymer transport system component